MHMAPVDRVCYIRVAQKLRSLGEIFCTPRHGEVGWEGLCLCFFLPMKIEAERKCFRETCATKGKNDQIMFEPSMAAPFATHHRVPKRC